MSSKKITQIAIGAALTLGCVFSARAAAASYGTEVEPNGTPILAQNIDPLFSREFDPDIARSTEYKHASIWGRGIATPRGRNHDWFSFNVNKGGTQGIFDIDWTRSLRSILSSCRGPIDDCPVDTNDRGFDTRLFLFDQDFLQLTLPVDDEFAHLGEAGSVANSPLGDGYSLDPYLEFLFPSAGTYYLGVEFVALDGFRRQQGEYTLHVSIQSVPEPTTVVGLLGIAAYAGLQLKRRKQPG